MSKPQFVSLEGIDKTGKTLICDILKTEYPDFEYVTDPPELDPWAKIFTNGTRYEIPGISDSFQFFSARLHCYQEKIQPALNEGTPVVADRFSDSWLAYQSVFQDEFFNDGIDPVDYFQEIHNLTEKFGLVKTPDLTILISINKQTLRERLDQTDEPTEFEESVDDQWKVHEQYQNLLRRESDRLREVRDEGEGITEVYSDVIDILEDVGFIE